MKSPRRVTEKQERLARARVKNPTAPLRVVGQKAGYSDPAHTKRALDRPHVQERIRKLMDASPKLRLRSLAKKLEEGLEATTVKYFAHEGVVQDEREQIDFQARARYLELASQWRGILERRLEIAGSGDVTVRLVKYTEREGPSE